MANWNIFKRFLNVEHNTETNRRLLSLATRDIADLEARLDSIEGRSNEMSRPKIITKKPVRTEKQKEYSRNYYLKQKAKKAAQSS